MKTKERIEITQNNEQKYGSDAKKIKWDVICVETKDYPDRPKSLITGNVMFIYPTGDICFEKITNIELWNEATDSIVKVTIPKQYLSAKKIVIRREIIAAVMYLTEKKAD